MRIGAPAVDVGAGIAEADIGARAAFDAVVAGELVALEQGGGVEHHALGVFVGNGEAADILFVRTREHLRHRLDDMAGPAGHGKQQRPAHFKPGGCHVTGKRRAHVVLMRPGLVAIWLMAVERSR